MAGGRLTRLGDLQRWAPLVAYGLLSLAVLGPLLAPGHVLTLDSPLVLAPDPIARFYGLTDGPLSAVAGLPFDLLAHFLGRAVPLWLVEKVFLFLLFFLAGLGAHRLYPSTGPGAYFAGLLYAVNPFTYSRFLAGQWGVLWAYAITPFVVKAFIQLLEHGDWRAAVRVALLTTLAGMLQVHGYALLLMAFAVLLLVRSLRTGGRSLREAALAGRWLVAAAGMALALNLYWLLPLLTSGETMLGQIGWADMALFSPKSSSALGVLFDTVSMNGFWRGGSIASSSGLSFWWLLFIPILFLAIYGLISRAGERTQGWVVLSLGVLGAASAVLAIGAASELTRPLFQWLWEHLPLFAGFRDSQKFVALLCLAYAYLGGLGAAELARTARRRTSALATGARVLAVAMLLVPPAYSFPVFGFAGRLGVTDFPAEWYQVREHISADEGDFNVLFFPWHQYQDYGWLPNRDKRLSNPAKHFFGSRTIAGDNMEAGGIGSQSTDPISRYVEALLGQGRDADFGELLAPLNVKYVLLVHEADYEQYRFLYEQPRLSVVLQLPGITLFRNEHRLARAYAVDSVVPVGSLEEYIELSRTQDVLEHLYVLGDGPDEGSGAGAESLSLTERSPVEYRVQGSRLRYTVFTVAQGMDTKHWEYSGRREIARNLGFMPAFESLPEGGSIVYSRFRRVYLPGYILSLLAVVGLAAVPVLRRLRRRRRVASQSGQEVSQASLVVRPG